MRGGRRPRGRENLGFASLSGFWSSKATETETRRTYQRYRKIAGLSLSCLLQLRRKGFLNDKQIRRIVEKQPG